MPDIKQVRFILARLHEFDDKDLSLVVRKAQEILEQRQMLRLASYKKKVSEGQRLSFRDGETVGTGVVVRKNRITVTISANGKRKRVEYGDLLLEGK